MNSPSVQRLFGIPLQAVTMRDAVDQVFGAVDSRKRLHIGVVNAAKVVNMNRNPELAASVLASDVIYADGMSVVWASKLLRRALPERIAGIDLMHEILHEGSSRGLRVFCLGAKQEVLDKVVSEFGRRYAGVEIVGARNGYFERADEESIASEIRDSRADVLFVAITSPKKERFMARWSELMNVPVAHGVGGSFDVVAGVVERAPERWQQLGMEWLYRVLQEPRRLWKRYLVTNVLFLGMTVRECFTRDRRA